MMWLERLLGQRHAHPQEHLSAYIDGALSPADAQRIAAHLDGCPECRKQADELRAIRISLRALSDPPLHRSFTLTASDAARLDEGKRLYAFWTRSYTYGRVASAGLAVVLIFLLGFDLFAARIPAGRDAGTFATGQATMSESANSAKSEADAPQPQAPAPPPLAQRANPVPPTATPPAAVSSAFSATPSQPSPTVAADSRAAATEVQPTPAPDGRSLAVILDKHEAPRAGGWSYLRLLEIIAGAVLVVVATSTLYIRARARRV